jgi:hypothetical protein
MGHTSSFRGLSKKGGGSPKKGGGSPKKGGGNKKNVEVDFSS